MNNKIIERAKMVSCMEFIARQINDEDVLDTWLMCGIPDGDIEYGNLDYVDIDDYYLDDNNFENLMSTFLVCMKGAYNSGGLYCGEIVSKDKNDYKKNR